jgi:hypothetical protein
MKVISADYIQLHKQCSIDALLDKTIAYMLFLQSVSEKAEKVSFLYPAILSHKVQVVFVFYLCLISVWLQH